MYQIYQTLKIDYTCKNQDQLDELQINNQQIQNTQIGSYQLDQNLEQDQQVKKENDMLQMPLLQNKDEFQDTIQRNIFRKQENAGLNEKLNQISQNEEKKSNDQEFELCRLFQNSNTIVELIYKSELKQFVIVKRNLVDENDFKSEYKILQMLKGKNITLDIVSKIDGNKQFQQIAGKIHLYSLKEKTQCSHLFEFYFFVLHEKLKQMHELGIAHSDIKPFNIVVSYQNEPFFIDFGGSVLLENYKYYLSSFTYFYNLNTYVEKDPNDDKKYIFKEFKCPEEAKLCDRTQLALTFLFLFCNDKQLLDLFGNKKWNEVLKIQFEKSEQNSRRLVLFIISSILNKADSNINIVGNEDSIIYPAFFLNLAAIREELRYSNDVVFNEENNSFSVNKIDQQSIRLLYLLDQSNCEIKMNPEQMIINPAIKLKEYQYIYNKYKQLSQYHESLCQNYDFKKGSNNLYNFFQYLQIKEQGNCSILIKDIEVFKEQIPYIKNAIKNRNLEFDFLCEELVFLDFVEILEDNLEYLQVQSIILGNQIEFKTKKNIEKKNDQIVQIKMNLFEAGKGILEHYQYVLNKYNRRTIDFYFSHLKYTKKSQGIFEKFLSSEIEESLQFCLSQMFGLIKLNTDCEINIKFKIFYEFNQQLILKSQQLAQIKEDYANINLRDNCSQNLKNIYIQLCEVIEDQNNLNDDEIYGSQGCQLLFDVKNILCTEMENDILLILNYLTKFVKNSCKIVIKFYNFLFMNLQIWEYLIKIINNNFIEVIIVNSQFDEKTISYLIEIQTLNYVKLLFMEVNDYNNKLESDLSDQQGIKSVNYDLNINIMSPQQQEMSKGILIKFYKQNSLFENENKIYDEKKHFVQEDQQQINNILNNSSNLQFKEIDLKNMQFMLGKHQDYRGQILDEYKFVDIKELNSVLIEIKNKHEYVNREYEKIDLIIQSIKNKRHFQKLFISYGRSTFNYEDVDQDEDDDDEFIYSIPHIKISYYHEDNSVNILDKFLDLYLCFINYYKHFLLIESYSCFKQIITQYKDYDSYQIEQSLFSCYQTDTTLKERDSIFSYYIDQQTSQEVIINLKYKINFLQIQKTGIYDEITEKVVKQKQISLNYKKLIENLNAFNKNYCFTRQKLAKLNFENKDYILQFNFSEINVGDEGFCYLFDNILNNFDHKQFIKLLILNNYPDIYLFEIQIYDYAIFELIKYELDYFYEIEQQIDPSNSQNLNTDNKNYILIMRYKQYQSQGQKVNPKFKIILDFDMNQFDQNFLYQWCYYYDYDDDKIAIEQYFKEHELNQDLKSQKICQILDDDKFMKNKQQKIDNGSIEIEGPQKEFVYLFNQQNQVAKIQDVFSGIFSSFFIKKDEKNNVEFDNRLQDDIQKIVQKVQQLSYLPILKQQLLMFDQIKSFLS
ncbi:hypothetical protein ABPG74_019773 [Tetrahymena malaccensis]